MTHLPLLWRLDLCQGLLCVSLQQVEIRDGWRWTLFYLLSLLFSFSLNFWRFGSLRGFGWLGRFGGFGWLELFGGFHSFGSLFFRELFYRWGRRRLLDG